MFFHLHNDSEDVERTDQLSFLPVNVKYVVMCFSSFHPVSIVAVFTTRIGVCGAKDGGFKRIKLRSTAFTGGG